MLGFLVVLVLCLAFRLSHATIIEVPNDQATISSALAASVANDTIWVRPGIYSDRLIFPAHDVVLISDFFMTGDSSAIDSTIIDASAFVNEDTASVLNFTVGSTRFTCVGGFTLTGGHGHLAPAGRWGGCLYLMNSSPLIHFCKITGNVSEGALVLYSEIGSPALSHCEIYGNCGWNQLLAFNFNEENEEPALVEWNNVHDNYACNSPFGPVVEGHGIVAQYGRIIVQFNHFHDYEGTETSGVFLYTCHAQIHGNTFERISTPYSADLIVSTLYANPITDNVFRDCTLGEGGGISLLAQSGQDHNFQRSLIERNWFENLTNSIGPSCLYMQTPNAEVRDNVFFNCRGTVGAVQFSQISPQGCDVVFERNQFYFNQAVGGADYTGSAFGTIGDGPPCTFASNWFEGNEGWSVHFMLVDSSPGEMSNNYWGDPSGPFHPIENPGGQGDSVPANVHVTPWLTSPPPMDTDIHERLRLQPEDWTVTEAFPNPFNASTNLRITSSKPQPFEVTAYNTLGQQVSKVWQGVIPKDSPTLIRWNGSDERGGSVASGIYYLVASPRGPNAGAPKSVKVILLK